ncbi:MAG: PDZ domain-containing protein [Planctomycetales bacterium]|nr:PDZ domain-containing protein [Planctomycetales bacterium]NIM08344.1 PDZ domain-containing protein [Planctomycetales bacterium]NIN07818.1 PDZ domain-containing protein [Planctomycetales bacterium]NIN76944.1 PDZ domain-containing protein [Planctomycetales bacterium]NIO34131.1 PDZ domain-containing protein [Planctomycetales bacterium]
MNQGIAELERQASVLKRVVKLVRPAVAHIEVRKGVAAGRRSQPADETGSGVIFQRDGNYYVLTNRHLIRSADLEEITISLADGREFRPTRKWMDAGTDIAVMAIRGKRLATASFGDSDKLEIGDYVLAIGSPFGLNHSVTFGIVSAKGRRDLELSAEGVQYQDFIQIDASINPGSSGGPLVNLRGKVIGINTAIASTSGHNEGIGFSIPINMADIIASQLIQHGEVRRGFLGVRLDSNFNAKDAARIGLALPRGARVSAVNEGTPAALAKLKVGDIILRFNGTWIENDSHLVNRVSLTKVGSKVPLVVYREGENVTLNVKLEHRPAWHK